jgi:hypothetical protein
MRRPVKLGIAVSLSGRYALLGRQAIEGVKPPTGRGQGPQGYSAAVQ